MNILLSEVETRVLGSLVEKELTTPEYYPLSLNALVNACNQKSNRDPAMNLDEEAVREALRTLDKKGTGWTCRQHGEPRYQHMSTACRKPTTLRGMKLPSWPSCCCVDRKLRVNCAAAPTACINSTTWASCSPRCSA